MTVADACERDERVLAGWLGGSLARGVADDWSDIDLHVIVNDEAAFTAAVLDWFGQLMPLVLADEIPGVPGGFIFLTPGWVHVDFVVHGADTFEPDGHPVKVLFDRAGLVHDVEPAGDDPHGGPYLPDTPSTTFLYFMGNLVTVARRGEWFALAQGTATMRDSLLIPLMLAQNGVRKSDGAKRLNRYLTDEQQAALRSIPAIGSDPEDLFAAQRAIAHEYLRRGRRLAAQVGAEWPDALESAVRELWARELGMAIE
ncbi:hypothetical protein GCM10023169_22140 [Georgenia halophila]|uniref:Polymerase nucleotidyl transferase domain-containing protein n=2 Tax=Georgenia halophila TaxID=620889 RepID=A0ABP8L9M0_9MICO